MLRWGFNSLFVAVVSTALSVLTGAMAGYALARMRFPGRNLLFGLFIASLMVPSEVSVVPLLLGMIADQAAANTYQALILPTVGNVFAVYIFRQFFLKFPNDLEDAARMDGAGHFLIFWRIGLPLAHAAMIATVILFTLNWNNFLWPLLVTLDETMKTLPVGIAAFAPEIGSHTQLEGFALGMAGVTVLSLPSLLLFFALQRSVPSPAAPAAPSAAELPSSQETSCVTDCSSMAVGSILPAGAHFASIDPATEEPIAEIARGGAADVDRAVKAANSAMRGPWSRLAPAERGCAAVQAGRYHRGGIARSWPGSRPWMSASRSGIPLGMSMAW